MTTKPWVYLILPLLIVWVYWPRCSEAKMNESCQRCDGYGDIEVDCPICDGTGRAEVLRCRRPFAPDGECCGGCYELATCPECGGRGRVYVECPECEE